MKSCREFSAWQWVGNDVIDALKRYPDSQITHSQIVAVIVVSINPATLGVSIENTDTRELARVFAQAYESNPNLIYDLIGTVRSKWNDQETVAAKVQKRITTEVWLTRPGNKSKGKLMHFAKDADFLERTQRINQLPAVKIARQRIRRPGWTPFITRELHAALAALKKRGYDVGDGNLNPPPFLPK